MGLIKECGFIEERGYIKGDELSQEIVREIMNLNAIFSLIQLIPPYNLMNYGIQNPFTS